MLLGRLHKYWTRPAGLREVLVMALPLVISTASWTVMQFVDRLFLLWYSQEALAAAMPAGMVAFVVVCFPLGVAAYANTFVSQYHGAGRPERIGAAVWQGVFLGVFCAPLVLATIPLAPAIFAWAGHGAEIAKLEVVYFQILCLGTPAMVVAWAISSFFSGRGDVRTVMVVNVLSVAVNIVLDYLWIFGYGGFPEWGMAGAAWATVVAQWFRMALWFVLFLRPAYQAEYRTLASCRLDRELFARLCRFGAPQGAQYVLELGGLALFLLLVGRLGPVELTATNLAFNVNSLAFMPVFGVGIAAATIVGQRLGEDRDDLAARASWSAFWLSTSYMLAVAIFYVLGPDLLLAAHGAGSTDPAEFARLRDLTAVLLRFVAFYCLFDSMGIIFSSAIKGAGDTRFVLYTTLAMAGIPAVGTWLGVQYFGLGLMWAWFVVTAWICLLSLAYLVRFMGGRWRSMRVIETEMLPDIGEVRTEAATATTG